MKRKFSIVCFLLSGLIAFMPLQVAKAEEPVETEVSVSTQNELDLNCKSAVLMEESTGKILYEMNAEESLPPASVTKVMTLLLIMEAIDSGAAKLDDMVSVSANAASMGGSQVFLKEGEQMKLEDLLKSVVIASANDAAVALAEYVCGSVPAFVSRMNECADELGMENTNFENVTGLDDTVENHRTSAKDIAIMSRALIAHKTILQYSSIWMDTIRDGAFGLTNTNRLVRFYPGCSGLKTGSTSKAGFCVSVTAQREGLSLICVIMGAESRDIRNAAAASLLDWGFANYALYTSPAGTGEAVTVTGGNASTCPTAFDSFSCVLPKKDVGKIAREIVLEKTVAAPVEKSRELGRIIYRIGETEIGRTPIYATNAVPKISFWEVFYRIFAQFLMI